MSYISPNTDLRILYDVPLDTTYEHSIYFDNPTAQYTYFSGKTKYALSELSYQRVQRGYVRVEKNAEDLYNCNYIMFRNTAFGTKWFYAFITGIEYISNTVSQISFTIDVIQTWFFDYSFNSCFIERTHTESDDIGEHYEPEPVAIGEYVLNDYNMLDSDLSELGIVTSVIELDNNSKPKGNIYEGIYSGTTLYFFEINGAYGALLDILNSFLARFVSTPDNVTGIYMCPALFIQGTSPSGTWPEITRSEESFHKSYTLNPLTLSDTLNGYQPRNKKLYTYPYNFLHVDNGGNAELSLRYEFFEYQTPMLELNGSCLEPVQALLVPKQYKGISGSYAEGNDKVYNPESLPLIDFPTCSWNFDTYKQWKNTQFVTKAIRYYGRQTSAILNAGVTTATRNASEGITEGVTAVGNNLLNYLTDHFASSYNASVQADICKGSTSNGQLNSTRKRQNYYYGRCSVNAQNAEIIDDFFDKYGYAINKIGMPNLCVRDVWTYIKTRNCTIVGSVPSGDMRFICNIFDKGITFWKDGDEVGRYDYADRNKAPQG